MGSHGLLVESIVGDRWNTPALSAVKDRPPTCSACPREPAHT
ncbi:hypothetical protein LI99_09380 [Mycolicibacterium smegmatis]|uniref:Uncharacterized protein n=1 Tax=Mycolicibacterium smegmatis (strain ATCC 700084 / mc(2)155) TaxID=246196 RepID=A0QTK7_MYCS2|nr:hypothetical protein MSMEG_1879 [Mycolicibacterium smegmatis MC2 155]AIU13726.1 hypothetical protein LI99_09380 [Mycolicibacterium smegmatis]AIU07101.1 hypothetical protein LJ00_09380 [Mycolicibacterium smegmatis MC2 155]AIU20350.1 hypothetical protein LI98_09380 [Mycolicibacterium smegmatis]TBH34253.1 hypothetical protein EYS45_19260 [Mycolicibacterium smegmatis MC2 155]